MPPFQDHPEAIIEITRRDLEDIIEGAAKRGAELALSQIGFGDEGAVRDVKELRDFMGLWRDMRSTAIKTFVQALTMAILGAVVLGTTIKLGLLGGPAK